MTFKITLITLIVMLRTLEIEPKPKKSVRFYLNNVTVEDSQFVRVEYTFYKDRKAPTVDVIAHITEDIKKPILAELQFLTKLPYQDKYQSVMTTDKIDVCGFFNKEYSDPIARHFYNNFMKHSNVTPSCPVPKGDYYANNLTIDANSVPPFLLAGNNIIILSAFHKPQNKLERLFLVTHYTTIER